MTMQIRLRPLLATALLSLALAACSTGPQLGLGGSSDAAVQASEIEEIATLLDRGDTKAAEKRLKSALKRDPLNPSLLVLQQGLTGDAKEALGPTNYPYMVAPGDTMASLAEKFLGNRLKSYQLARYNDIADPSTLAEGRVLHIPGTPPQAGSEAKSKGPAPAKKSRPAVAAPTPSKPQAPAAAPVTRTADKAGARRARTAGLAALNKGDVGQAVSLLQRAATLDPGNAAIEGDLARARRIAATVRSQR